MGDIYGVTQENDQGVGQGINDQYMPLGQSETPEVSDIKITDHKNDRVAKKLFADEPQNDFSLSQSQSWQMPQQEDNTSADK